MDDDDGDDDDDDDDGSFLRSGWPSEGVKPYLQLRLLSEILIIANLRHTASRTSTCAGSEFRLCSRGCAVVITTALWRHISDFDISLNVTQLLNCENELNALFMVCVIGNGVFSIYWRLRYFQVLLPSCKTYTFLISVETIILLVYFLNLGWHHPQFSPVAGIMDFIQSIVCIKLKIWPELNYSQFKLLHNYCFFCTSTRKQGT